MRAVNAQLEEARGSSGGAAEGPARVVGHLLGEAKVDQLQVAVRAEEQILRLEVAVCNLPPVQEREDADDDARVGPSVLLLQKIDAISAKPDGAKPCWSWKTSKPCCCRARWIS